MTSTPAAEPRHIPVPRIEHGQPYCPRCSAMLRLDHDEYVCVACGYEYLLEPRDIEILRAARQRMRRAAAVLPLAGLPLLGGAALVVGVIALVAVGLLTRRRRRATVEVALD